MSECIHCGGDAVPGKLGNRCRDCIGDLLEDEVTIVLETVGGQTRRLRIREAVEPGVGFAFQEDVDEADGDDPEWRPLGREQLSSVEINGADFEGAGAQGATRGP